MNTLVASRSKALQSVRSFFYERDYFEVDPPVLSRGASVDLFIDPFSLKETGEFLFTSPEYPMKRILTTTSANLFFLGHVFRNEPPTPRHSPEFTMIEWYKIRTSEKDFLKEAVDLISLFLPACHVEMLTYDDAFLRYARDIDEDISRFSPIEKRHYQLATQIEPNLGQNGLTILHAFPPEEAALARLHTVQGKTRAARYEIFYKGVELGNGFEELSDMKEQRARLMKANKARIIHGKAPLPPDEAFLAALEKGLPPDTFGMALGFDRLFQIKEGAPLLSDIIHI